MNNKYIMALDQGTTSSRCLLFDRAGNSLAETQIEFTQYYPKPGLVEQDAMEIWQTQLASAKETLIKTGSSHADIAAIGITNQRETTIVWDKNTGKPIYHAIVWQCRRTADDCLHLKEQGLSDTIHKKTGLLIDAYFSATKLRWLLDHVEGARKRAEAGELLFGTMDTWLIWNLTGGKVHATDYTNASRTMLFHIKDCKWDEELLELFHIPECMMPDVYPSGHLYGETDPGLFGGRIPIAGAAGDQQASLFGQACFASGDVKNTYGTGCFMLMNTATQPILSENGLLTTIACGFDDTINYALEGSVFVAGAAVQWLRDEMKIIKRAEDTDAIAKSVSDTSGVYVVPAFVGLGAPYWNAYARGSIVGLTRGAGRAHIVRAVLESIAYQTADILAVMEEESGIHMTSLQVDGGACANDFLMQFQADILNITIERPSCIETTARGAAYLAGMTIGFYHDEEMVKQSKSIERVFWPGMKEELRSEKKAGWKKAVRMTQTT
jgi:glycerol kinase